MTTMQQPNNNHSATRRQPHDDLTTTTRQPQNNHMKTKQQPNDNQTTTTTTTQRPIWQQHDDRTATT